MLSGCTSLQSQPARCRADPGGAGRDCDPRKHPQLVGKFGTEFAKRLRKRRPKPGDVWHLDEVFIRINGTLLYLWRAVDHHGVVLDILVQGRRNAEAAKRFFKRLLRGLQYKPGTARSNQLVAEKPVFPGDEGEEAAEGEIAGGQSAQIHDRLVIGQAAPNKGNTGQGRDPGGETDRVIAEPVPARPLFQRVFEAAEKQRHQRHAEIIGAAKQL